MIQIANIQLAAANIALAFTGILITGYLIRQHIKKKPLICPGLHDCTKVTESKYSAIFGIRNDYLGFLFFAISLAVIITSIFRTDLAQLIYLALILISGAALISTLILVYIQIYKIRDYCLYCLAASLTILLIFLNSLLLYLGVFS